MSKRLQRVFLDTNIYILGTANPTSSAGRILRWLGYNSQTQGEVTVIVSNELFYEIRRVARRLQNKDWAGQILSQIWRDLRLHHVNLTQSEIEQLTSADILPTEDIEVYLTAKNGKADCFVSTNRELIRAAVQQTNDFECLTPDEFIIRYKV